jgi:hypothetical protein
MSKYKNIILMSAPILVIFISVVIFGFSIFTNSQGYARRYLDSDIPFVYMLNNITPANYVPAIDAGTQAWENVPSSYWEFENGGFTAANTDIQDGINLIFFDIQGVNFTPGTNVIAYSRTWTTGSGSAYHAIESDLVWNARDYPPSTTGAFDQQDLQSVIAHEVGHHLGLGHAGPVGGPPGVGPLILQATMYGQSANGDTTKRSLHIDDIAGVSAIYPVWILQGNVTDANTGLPLPEVGLTSDTIFSSEVFAPIFSNNYYQRPGYFRDTLLVNTDGSYQTTILVQNFNLSAVYFGYQSVATIVSFGNPGGIGQTETQTVDFQLQPSPIANISGVVRDSVSGVPIASRVMVLPTSNKPGKPVGFIADTTTGTSGNFSFDLPADEHYLVRIRPEPPYPEASYLIENLPVNGAVIEFGLLPAEILLVNDDPLQKYETEFITSLETNSKSYYLWRTATDGIPDSSVFEKFFDPKVVIWYTGDANDTVLSSSKQQNLVQFLDSGGNLILTGQNIVEKSDSLPLLKNYAGVTFDKNLTTPITSGVSGDPITSGMIVSTVGGAGNQVSKDAYNVSQNAQPILNYGTTTLLGVAGIRNEDNQKHWKLVCFGFGLEGVNNTEGIRDTLLQRILNWFEKPLSIGEQNNRFAVVPKEYELKQNYPNPFNASTLIEYSLPKPSDVILEIYNLIGQQVRVIVDERQRAGVHSIFWNGRDKFDREVASGIYLYRLKTDTYQRTKKMIMIK